jgi:hypothetical protein
VSENQNRGKNYQTEITMTGRVGGKRLGAGRKPGSLSTATKEAKATLSELARAHTATAIKTLVRVASKSSSDSAAVAAATAILDRGYGKPVQSIEHAGEGGGPIEAMVRFILEAAPPILELEAVEVADEGKAA